MIPDPILALLALVGLLVYCGIGGVTAGIVAKRCGISLYAGHWMDEAQPFFSAIGWPVVLVGAAAWSLLSLPRHIVMSTSRYVAQIGKDS